MPRIRSEFHIRREPITLLEDVDISTYDRIGKRGADALGTLGNTGEAGEFLYLESGSAGEVVTVAFFGGTGTAARLKLSGTGSKGSHLTVGSDGVIQASNTDSTAELTETELGVALADWTDGDDVECELYKV